MGNTARKPSPIVKAALVVQHENGSTTTVEVGPASYLHVDRRRRLFQRRRVLRLTFMDVKRPAVVRSDPSGAIPTPPGNMPELNVDTTDWRFESNRRTLGDVA